jgi:hypothetical protein
MVAIKTPMDAGLGRLAADLRGTVIYYGDTEEREQLMLPLLLYKEIE